MKASSTDNILINNITFSYGDKLVFKDFSTAFPKEQLSVIMSPSGSGKTTLLYLIAGLLSAEGGSITYPIDNPTFSMVFQDSRLIDHISVLANIKLVNSSLSDTDITDCLGAMKLDGFLHKKVKQLSGGEKQRVAIARALLAQYDILLMDEPFTGLDDKTKVTVMEYIKNKTAGKTVLLVTHDKSVTEALGDSNTCLYLQ